MISSLILSFPRDLYTYSQQKLLKGLSKNAFKKKFRILIPTKNIFTSFDPLKKSFFKIIGIDISKIRLRLFAYILLIVIKIKAGRTLFMLIYLSLSLRSNPQKNRSRKKIVDYFQNLGILQIFL